MENAFKLDILCTKTGIDNILLIRDDAYSYAHLKLQNHLKMFYVFTFHWNSSKLLIEERKAIFAQQEKVVF